MPTTMTDDDRHVLETGQRLEADQRMLAEAREARDALGRLEAGRIETPTLRTLTLDDAVAQAAQRVVESTKLHEVAQYQRAVRRRTAYRARALTRTRAALTAALALADDLHADRADRDGLAVALGLAAGSGAHPHHAATELVRALEHAIRELAPPPPPPAPPVPPGKRRIHVRETFAGGDGTRYFATHPGGELGPVVVPEPDGIAAIKAGWGIEVDA